ncbi:MAG TPA: DUF362 domain-containing protein [Actinomycetota bacterium]|nr:DUF362 domain-containing protein [Actinomycetota bacterium]
MPSSSSRSGRISRRDFLVRSANAGLAATLAGLLGYRFLRREPEPWDHAAFPPPGEARVAVVPAASYEADLEALVLDGLRAVGADLRGRRVLLKPNLVEFVEGTTINTDPRLVAAAVLAARRLGAASVVVAEGPGHRRDTELVVAESGLLEALREVGAPFVDLNAAELVRLPLASRFSSLEALWLPRPVVEADLVVSMPKMKTHHWAGVTLSLKNCFGCVPGRVYGWPKNVLHWAGIQEAIVDVAAAVRPGLAIVDGIVGMEGNGPIQGTPVRAGVLLFGDDPVATDVTAARLMGVDPARVPYLAQAARFLGQGDPERIRQEGEEPARHARPFALLPGFSWLREGAPPPGPGGPAFEPPG